MVVKTVLEDVNRIKRGALMKNTAVSRYTGLLLAFVVCVNALAGDKGGLQKIWQHKVADFSLPDNSAGKELGVYSLSFSPGGQRIAAVLGSSWHEQFILILDAANPEKSSRKIDVSPNIYEQDPATYKPMIWSASGQQILIGTKIINIETGTSCSFSKGSSLVDGYFPVDPNHLALAELKPAQLSFYDWECQETGVETMPDLWFIMDSSPERNLLLIRKKKYAGDFLMRIDASKIIESKQWLPANHRKLRFTDSGKTICSVEPPQWHESVGCRDVDTSKDLSISKRFTSIDIRPALRASRVVVSDFNRKLDLIDFFWYTSALKKRIVWDYQTGKELVSWKPQSQNIVLGYKSNTGYVDNTLSQPFRFALSPDGHYIIEGGAGLLSLYKID
jgi:hypothetical protein